MQQQTTNGGACPALERLLTFADNVQAMRVLERKQSEGLNSDEFNRLSELKNKVDNFFMLPKINYVKAQ